MSEITIGTDVGGAADALTGELGLIAAFRFASALAAKLRERAEFQRVELEEALGQVAKAPARTRAGAQRPAAPTTQTEATERVSAALAALDANQGLSSRALQARTGATAAQVAAALKAIAGVARHGRKYALKGR